MSSQLCMGRDPERPGYYKIIRVHLRHPDGSCSGRDILWRDLRTGDPEAFVALARSAFADWCQQNGYTG